MKMRVKLRQRLVPLLIVLLLGLQYNDPARAYTILLITLGGMFIISFVWARSVGTGMTFHRDVPFRWVQVGHHMEEHLVLINTSWFPAAYIEFIDHSTLPAYSASRVTSISANSSDEWSVPVFCTQRGAFQFGDAQIITSDPLGIFEVTLHAALQNPLLVLPQPAILAGLPVASAGVMGEGQPRRDASQQSMHVSTVREFAQGDSVRLIHWPTTARKNKTFVRLMENAPEGNWWIVLDLDQNYMRGSGWDSIEEQSVSLAASLADLGLRGRKPTGLVSNGQEFVWLPPEKGDAHQWKLLEALAVTKPGRLALAGLFEKISAPLGNHHSLLIITACTQTDWMKSLPSLMKRGVIPTVFLMDPCGFTGMEEGIESMEIAAATLAKQNIRHHIIPHGMIEPPQTELIPLESRGVPTSNPIAAVNHS
jgi:uncharacterized protein (DUF58 family)